MGFSPRPAQSPNSYCVAERRLKIGERCIRASLRDARGWAAPEPWVKTHGYLQSTAPRCLDVGSRCDTGFGSAGFSTCCIADWQSADRSVVRAACGPRIESGVKAGALQTLARAVSRLEGRLPRRTSQSLSTAPASRMRHGASSGQLGARGERFRRAAETDRPAAGAPHRRPPQRGGGIPAQGKRRAALGKQAAQFHFQTASEAPARPTAPQTTRRLECPSQSGVKAAALQNAAAKGLTLARTQGGLMIGSGWCGEFGAQPKTDRPAAGATWCTVGLQRTIRRDRRPNERSADYQSAIRQTTSLPYVQPSTVGAAVRRRTGRVIPRTHVGGYPLQLAAGSAPERLVPPDVCGVCGLPIGDWLASARSIGPAALASLRDARSTFGSTPIVRSALARRFCPRWPAKAPVTARAVFGLQGLLRCGWAVDQAALSRGNPTWARALAQAATSGY